MARAPLQNPPPLPQKSVEVPQDDVRGIVRDINPPRQVALQLHGGHGMMSRTTLFAALLISSGMLEHAFPQFPVGFVISLCGIAAILMALYRLR